MPTTSSNLLFLCYLGTETCLQKYSQEAMRLLFIMGNVIANKKLRSKGDTMFKEMFIFKSLNYFHLLKVKNLASLHHLLVQICSPWYIHALRDSRDIHCDEGLLTLFLSLCQSWTLHKRMLLLIFKHKKLQAVALLCTSAHHSVQSFQRHNTTCDVGLPPPHIILK